eukprot:2460139-Karenia_brevis.AAC.1
MMMMMMMTMTMMMMVMMNFFSCKEENGEQVTPQTPKQQLAASIGDVLKDIELAHTLSLSLAPYELSSDI